MRTRNVVADRNVTTASADLGAGDPEGASILAHDGHAIRDVAALSEGGRRQWAGEQNARGDREAAADAQWQARMSQ